MFRRTSIVVIVSAGGLIVLGELGVSIAPSLATAAVASIAIAFGAQSLVRDFCTGLLLLVENQISEGDVIEVAGKSGCVEEITPRHVRIRDYDSSVHFIPNGIITTLTNNK